MQKSLFGIDRFITRIDEFRNIRFAMVTNDAATTSSGILSRVAVMRSGLNLVKLFSPEHGLTAQGPDGSFQENKLDPVTDLPVTSLYGDRLKPSEDDLRDIGAVLFDIPDVGCRFYTYLWTLTFIMEACAEFDRSLFILDRPNPIGGDFNSAEGPMLDETNCSSFIGRWSIPVRHCCTLGELARYFAATRVKTPHLEIIKVQNWKRGPLEREWNGFFLPPSPAIHDKETAFLYPGTGLLEGINVNEGRGTGYPFKIFGAPWIDAFQIRKEFESLQLPGIASEASSYKPAHGLYANEYCHGLKLSVTDEEIFRPVLTGLKIIQLIISRYPEHCRERAYKTTANPTGENHLDKLTGIFHSFERIKNLDLADFDLTVPAWKETMRPYLLYA